MVKILQEEGGDLNGHVGDSNEGVSEIMGKHGLEEDEQGRRENRRFC